MKSISTLVIIILLSSVSLETKAQGKLVKTNLGDGITIKVPSTFVPMSETDMWQRISSYRKSLALYTDMNRLVELGVNRSFSIWDGEDYELMHEMYKSSILELYDSVNFIQDEIKTVRKKQFVVFEFTSEIKADESTGRPPITKYIYIQYTIHKDQTLVFDFTCPTFQMEEWKETAADIMNSVSLR